jgi:hypothetical protein
MDRKPVNSSAIKSVGHDKSSQTLEVEFNSGAVHRYTGVNSVTASKLRTAKSVGGFFAANIRDAYPSERVDEATPPAAQP